MYRDQLEQAPFYWFGFSSFFTFILWSWEYDGQSLEILRFLEFSFKILYENFILYENYT